MTRTGLVFIGLLPAIVVGLRSLNDRRKAAADAFLARARVVSPLRVTQDYDMVVWHWRFWRWARKVNESQIEDRELLAASASLRKLDRIHFFLFVLAFAAAAALVAWYPWQH